MPDTCSTDKKYHLTYEEAGATMLCGADRWTSGKGKKEHTALTACRATLSGLYMNNSLRCSLHPPWTDEGCGSERLGRQPNITQPGCVEPRLPRRHPGSCSTHTHHAITPPIMLITHITRSLAHTVRRPNAQSSRVDHAGRSEATCACEEGSHRLNKHFHLSKCTLVFFRSLSL